MKKAIFIGIVMFLLMVSIALAYPPLMYNKYRVNKTEVDRFKTIINQIPEEYFEGIEVITIRNRPHPLYDYDGYFKFWGYRTYITIYNFEYLENNSIKEILLHELGHFNEFKQLKLNHSIYEISCMGLSEAYAENWRKQNGGNKEDCYSSDRTIC